MRTHHYHADGSALGGIIKLPRSTVIPDQSNVSLAPAGGQTFDNSGSLSYEDIVSCCTSDAHAQGNENPNTNAWSTFVSTAVNGLSICNTLRMDRVVSQILVEHPASGYVPTVSFKGSQFVNVSICGMPATLTINEKILYPGPVPDPAVNWTENTELCAAVKAQKESVISKGIPSWASDLYIKEDPPAQVKAKGHFVCSLVESISVTGDFKGEICGHIVRVPNVGKFIFGEVAVEWGSFRVVMVRAELGSPVTGSISAAASRTNGYSSP